MTANSPSTEDVANDFIAVVTHVMKRSSVPIVEFVEQHDINFTQMKMMFILGNVSEPLAIGQLAEMTGASLPAAGRAVDGLVRAGLASRTEDPDDRRIKRVEVTELGNEGVQKIYEGRLAALRAYLDGLTNQQLADISAALAPLREQIANGPNNNCETSKKEVSR